MNVVALVGYSGSGKTTLLEKLIPALKRRGQRVSVVKHAHHRFDVDQPGKDSYRHRQAGAYEVMLASNQRLALMREQETPTEPNVHALIAQMSRHADWVLVEGFRDSDLPKIEIWRAVAGHALRYPDDPYILAIATERHPATSPGDAYQLPQPVHCHVLDLNQAEDMADWLIERAAAFVYYPEPVEPIRRSTTLELSSYEYH